MLMDVARSLLDPERVQTQIANLPDLQLEHARDVMTLRVLEQLRIIMEMVERKNEIGEGDDAHEIAIYWADPLRHMLADLGYDGVDADDVVFPLTFINTP